MSIVAIQIGFSNSHKEHQGLSAFLNGDKLTWSKSEGEWNGQFLTQTSKRQSSIWFLVRCECKSGDVIRLESKVFIRGAGPDEERSRVVEWLVDESLEPIEYEIRKVGDSHFPLVSGRLVLTQTRTKLDDRRDSGESLIRESQEQDLLE